MFCMMTLLPFQPSNYLSDIGGVLGLWVGFSMLTITEFVELLMDIIMLKFGPRWLGSNQGTSSGKAPPTGGDRSASFHMGLHPMDKADFPAVEETSDLDTDQSESINKDNGRKKKVTRKGRKPTRKQVVPSSDYGSDTSAENRSKLPCTDSGDVTGYTPSDYVENVSPPPPYSSRQDMETDLNGTDSGRHTSRDIHLQLA